MVMVGHYHRISIPVFKISVFNEFARLIIFLPERRLALSTLINIFDTTKVRKSVKRPLFG